MTTHTGQETTHWPGESRKGTETNRSFLTNEHDTCYQHPMHLVGAILSRETVATTGSTPTTSPAGIPAGRPLEQDRYSMWANVSPDGLPLDSSRWGHDTLM